MTIRFIAMSGTHGCLPDYCEVFSSRNEAIQSLVQLFNLGELHAARLRQDGYLELVQTLNVVSCCGRGPNWKNNHLQVTGLTGI